MPGYTKHISYAIHCVRLRVSECGLSCLNLLIITMICCMIKDVGCDWCELDTGYTIIHDGRGIRHSVFLSMSREGGVWARLGVDGKSQDWIYNEETSARFQTTMLSDDDVTFLRAMDYMDYCVVSDLTLTVWAEGGWHPSYLSVFDPVTKDTNVVSFKLNNGCTMNTVFSLSSNKQGLFCDGGKHNSCGLRHLPDRRHTSHTGFIQLVKLDPGGIDRAICETEQTKNQYTFHGSYYYVYVKLADCPAPWESREFGHEAKLRALPMDNGPSNVVLIPDPTQMSLSDGVIIGWRVFVKIVSIQHEVYLQVWRPLLNYHNLYSLVGQTHYKPQELRFHEVVLSPTEHIRVRKGDVLGLYFTNYCPIAWSSVPCAFEMQKYRYIDNPDVIRQGMAKQFNTTQNDSGACRQYSFTAIFGNKSDAKLVDDWVCPTSKPRMDIRRRAGEQQKKNQYKYNLDDDVMAIAPTRRRHPLVNSSNGVIFPLHLILIIAGCLILMLVLIGFISYYRAVKS